VFASDGFTEGIFRLQPGLGRSASIRGVETLRHDAFEAEPADVIEYGRAIVGDVLVVDDRVRAAGQDPGQALLAIEKRLRMSSPWSSINRR
jgi:hypothetical protein